ncbi:maleylpyruvate isomerase N-terminal domain-containing protein [Saccharothrix sp. NPDC042600]|uniref:maleylpyruvate isomerase N-terminal domain-containing protein n=1 Tax=Saccharothrix TaxID=2071 RepID=UPI0033DDA999|nr:maleylpyruvate isomerase family mycothiol-dependent enzyme [Saccharothrix mutabilis subsp. capreolus]
MHNTLEFADLLRLIDERSAAFCAAVAAAPGLGAPVPTCPGWTLFDLVQHLGAGRRAWAATIAAGPADAKAVPAGAPPAPRELPALLDWMADSTRALLDALREYGPDRECWTWWSTSQSPRTSGAAARHQLPEIAVHTYDAQVTAGNPQALPTEVALDGVEDFLFTCCATTSPWPHEPAVVDYHTTEGPSWRLWLSAAGARAARLAADAPPDASARGSAHELITVLYGRNPVDSLELEGDVRVFDRLVAWEPE